MSKRLKDIGFKKKFTAAYIIFIIVPLFTLTIYVYNKTNYFIKSEIINNGQATLEQISNNIKNKLDLIEGISNNISNNCRFQRFLNNTFEMSSYHFDEYYDYILPLIQYSSVFQKVNIQDVSVYMNNHTIPEGYGLFFHDNRIKQNSYFKKFNESNKKTTWLLSSKNDFSNTYISDCTPSFFCVQKITTIDNKYLGIIAINIYLENLLTSISNISPSDRVVFLYDNDNNLIFSNDKSNILPKNFNIDKFNNEKSYFVDKDNLYLYKKIPSLNVTLGMMVSMSKEYRSVSKIPITILCFIIILVFSITFFYVGLDKIFSMINKDIKTMDDAILSNFETRIPVDRKDELGQIRTKFNILLDKINTLINDIVKKETAHKDAQLKALQYQINPHFIYNTLDIFAQKSELAGSYDISEGIADFGKMLRYNINSKTMYTSINLELQYAQSYINLQKLKYEEKLNLIINIPQEFLNFNIIKFILQPILENSILHGFNEKLDLLNITIDFEKQNNNQLKITITDTGIGIDNEKIISLNNQFKSSNYVEDCLENQSHIGLKNINERLKLFYGSQYFIKLESVKGKYTKTILMIPIL